MEGATLFHFNRSSDTDREEALRVRPNRRSSRNYPNMTPNVTSVQVTTVQVDLAIQTTLIFS